MFYKIYFFLVVGFLWFEAVGSFAFFVSRREFIVIELFDRIEPVFDRTDPYECNESIDVDGDKLLFLLNAGLVDRCLRLRRFCSRKLVNFGFGGCCCWCCRPLFVETRPRKDSSDEDLWWPAREDLLELLRCILNWECKLLISLCMCRSLMRNFSHCTRKCSISLAFCWSFLVKRFFSFKLASSIVRIICLSSFISFCIESRFILPSSKYSSLPPPPPPLCSSSLLSCSFSRRNESRCLFRCSFLMKDYFKMKWFLNDKLRFFFYSSRNLLTSCCEPWSKVVLEKLDFKISE